MKFFTALNRPVDCDVEKRMLRGAVFATTGLASDGAILLPSGMDLARFIQRPVILDDHQDVPGATADHKVPNVVANAADLDAGELELSATVQFADTARGRDFAYLYGCNPAKEVYMRAWSVEAAIAETQQVDWPTAQKLSAQFWDAPLAARMQKRGIKRVLVGLSSDLKAVAAVPYGADRGALTRAGRDGVAAASELVARLDLDAATSGLDHLKSELSDTNERITRLEKDIQALRGEGASAAARGDSEALLNEVRELLKMAEKIR